MDDLEQLQQRLSQPLPEIPTWYLYDPVGIRLFEQITQLPEYYLARIETALLAKHGGPLVRQLGVRRLAELGSGSSQKIVPLLNALPQGSYTLFDVAGDAVRSLAQQLAAQYPKLSVQALQGNFYTDLHLLGPGGGPRLMLLLGNTFANLASELRP